MYSENKNITIFSLIMATLGRKEEVKTFLESLLNQTFNLEKVELIIIDQNKSIILDELIKNYKHKLNIILIKSQIIGLSVNRNIGIEHCSGQIIAFPDDDCYYYPDTLKVVHDLFINDSSIQCIMGRIYDRENHRNIIRSWKDYEFNLNKFNYYKNVSSITIFSKFTKKHFCTHFGVGSYYGSNEDTNYIYDMLSDGIKVQYNPHIQVYHPPVNQSDTTVDKIISYGLGFGGFIRCNISFQNLFLYLQAISYHLIKSIFYLAVNKKSNSIKSYNAFQSRIKGFVQYGQLLIK